MSDGQRWMLVVEYDGRDFIGWGLQPTGRSVQGVMEQALETFLDHPIRVAASGRTDAGVHARGQVISFVTTTGRDEKTMTTGLNHHLPWDVAVLRSQRVPMTFDPRRASRQKHYRFVWLRRMSRSPLLHQRAHHVTCELDVARMNAAVAPLCGTYDFKAFRAKGCGAKSTVRTIPEWRVSEHGDQVHLDVRGNGFLRHMIRIVAGTLTDIGRGNLPPETLARALEAGDRSMAG
ncbi:MAG: tRNA pseudouridine(38-40) synthase TruA, partial [Myxococcota bacterium]